MAAGMHLALVVGGEGQAGLLLDRQGVNIGAQRHGLAGLAAVNGGGQAVAGLQLVNIGDASASRSSSDGRGCSSPRRRAPGRCDNTDGDMNVSFVLFRKSFDIQ